MDWEMEKLQISICTLDRPKFKEKVWFYMIEYKHYYYRDLTPIPLPYTLRYSFSAPPGLGRVYLLLQWLSVTLLGSCKYV